MIGFHGMISKNIRRRKGKKKYRLAVYSKLFFSIFSIVCILTLFINSAYFSVPVLAFTFPNSVVKDILIANIIGSLSLGSFGQMTNEAWVGGLVSGFGQVTCEQIAEEFENDPNYARSILGGLIDDAEQAGSVGLRDWLEIDQDEADEINTQNPTGEQVPTSSAEENLYLTINETVKKAVENTNNNYGSGALELVPAIKSAASDALNLVAAGASIANTAYQLSGIGRYGNNIKTSTSVTTNKNAFNFPSGYSTLVIKEEGRYDPIIYGDSSIIFCAVPNNDRYDFYACNVGSGKHNILIKSLDGNTGNFTSANNLYQISTYRAIANYTNAGDMSGNISYFSNLTEMEQYIANVKNGTLDRSNPVSPDIVNPNGNAEYNINNNSYNFSPVYNTNNQYLSPVDITSNDFNNFINTLNQNTTNNNYETNSQVFNDFINNYIQEFTTPPPDTTPDIPTQPETDPLPTLTPEQEDEVKSYLLPDLKQIFPFCIPFDMYALLSNFASMDREAPEIDGEIDLGPAGKHEIHLDLSEYDEVAELLRALELIGFIAGLAVATRKLIGD